MRPSFRLAAALTILPLAAAAAPPGYHLVYSALPAATTDIGNAFGYPGGPAFWFYNGEFCCEGDPQRPASSYDVTPNGATGPTYPFIFASQSLQLALQRHPNNGYIAPNGSMPNANGYWTMGILTSTDQSRTYGHTWRYGYFEWTAKVPLGTTPGTWPALYFKSVNQTQPTFEFDVLEHYGLFPNAYSATVDNDTNGSFQACNVAVLPAGQDLGAAEHRYGMLWTATTITFFFDGLPLSAYSPTDPACQPYPATAAGFANPAYAIMDMGVGGAGIVDVDGILTARNNPAGLPRTSLFRIYGFAVYEPN